jgi:hypothetical protein
VHEDFFDLRDPVIFAYWERERRDKEQTYKMDLLLKGTKCLMQGRVLKRLTALKRTAQEFVRKVLDKGRCKINHPATKDSWNSTLRGSLLKRLRKRGNKLGPADE